MTSSLIQLAAGDAAATVAPADGGMLLSLRVAGHELLVGRREGTSPVPTFGSFLMAPWVGELSLGELEFRGTRARFPRNRGRHAIHGLVANGAWDVAHTADTSVTLLRRLTSPWPFGGSVAQVISLDPEGITLEAEVRAGDVTMPAALGWHPWFACPDPARVRVRVAAAHELELDDELLPTGHVRDVAGDTDLRAGPVLGDRSIDSVFVDAESPALLVRPGLELKLDFDPGIVVVYTSPGAVCIEPWSAWPDAVRMAAAGLPSGLHVLDPGTSLLRRTRWEWSATSDATRW